MDILDCDLYNSIIIENTQKVQIYSTAYDFFPSDDFFKIFLKPNFDINCAKNIILDDDKPMKLRIVAALSIQRIDQHELIKFKNEFIDAYFNGRLDERIIENDNEFMINLLDTLFYPETHFNVFSLYFIDIDENRDLAIKIHNYIEQKPNIKTSEYFKGVTSYIYEKKSKDNVLFSIENGQGVMKEYIYKGHSLKIE